MTKYFRTSEVELTIPYMIDGITRGDFSHLIFLVIGLIKDLHMILKEIAFKQELATDMRDFCFWLYLQVAKFHSVDETLKTAKLYLEIHPSGQNDEAIVGVIERIRNGDLWPVG